MDIRSRWQEAGSEVAGEEALGTVGGQGHFKHSEETITKINGSGDNSDDDGDFMGVLGQTTGWN